METNFFQDDFIRSVKRTIYIGVAVKAVTAVAVLTFSALALRWALG